MQQRDFQALRRSETVGLSRGEFCLDVQPLGEGRAAQQVHRTIGAVTLMDLEADDLAAL